MRRLERDEGTILWNELLHIMDMMEGKEHFRESKPDLVILIKSDEMEL